MVNEPALKHYDHSKSIVYIKIHSWIVPSMGLDKCIMTHAAFLVAQIVKNLPAIQEIQVQLLGREDPLEKGVATHLSMLAWRIPWTEEPGGLQSMGSQGVGHD